MKLNNLKKITDIIDIQKLEHETRKLLYAGLVIAVVLNGILGIFVKWKRVSVVREVYRRITTDLIIIPRRKTEPLQILRKDAGVKTLKRERRVIRLPDGEIHVKSPPAVDELPDRYTVDVDSLISAVRNHLDGELIKRIRSYDDLARIVLERYYEDLAIQRDPYGKSKISLHDELLSIKDFDFGKYKGLIHQDIDNKQNIEGFVYIPVSVYGTMLAPVDSTKRAVAGLSEAFTTFTGITVHVDKQIHLDSPSLLNYPFLYINADDNFILQRSEKENLKNYLSSGGFVFLEAFGKPTPELPPKGGASLKKMLTDALGAAISLVPIPNDHLLYHCFFDLEDGPPRSINEFDQIPGNQQSDILEGVFIDSRLVALYSEKSYGNAWNKKVVSQAYQKIGVNAVVLALIQHGGNSFKLIENAGIIQ